ncbi:hypothetical protein A3842_30110 [Paenibacillus sp. P3E]|nr:hypothetical protein A3842_30110 [Paenibacillus sp. P3E]
MIAVAAAAGISSVKDGVVQPIDGCVNDTNEVIFWNVFFQIHWQAKLVHGILNVQRNRSFFEMVARHFHFTKGRFLFVIFERIVGTFPRLNSGEGGLIAEKR